MAAPDSAAAAESPSASNVRLCTTLVATGRHGRIRGSSAAIAQLVDQASPVKADTVADDEDPKGVVVSIAGKELCALAKRVPQNKVAKGDLSDQKAAARQYTAQVNIIQFMHYNPDRIEKIWADIQSEEQSDKKKKKRTGVDDVTFPSTYMILDKVPKYWQAAWIVDFANGKLTKDDVDYLDTRDNTAVGKIWHILTKTHPDDYLPREFLLKARCAKGFTRRASLLDGRLDWILEGVDDETGTVEWKLAAPYRLTFEAEGDKELLHTVTHCSGLAKCIKGEHIIDRTWELEDAIYDQHARLTKGKKGCLYLHTLFEDHTESGPNYLITEGKKPPTALSEFAAEIKAEESVDNSLAASVGEGFLQGDKAAKKQQQRERMSERMADKKAEVKRSKVIKLS